MGKLFRNILLFSLPFWGMLGWLWWSAPTDTYRHQMIQKDCRTGMWIHRRLRESRVPIDVAFIGTSKTMCDVNDALLEQRVTDSLHRPCHIANLGVCRIGENLHYLVAKALMQEKTPRYLVLEVGQELNTNSHMHFPYMAMADDVLGAPVIGNSDFWGDIVDFTWYRLVYQRDRALGIPRSYRDFLSDTLHSFMVVPADGHADSTMMAQTKARRQRDVTAELPTGLAGWWASVKARAPKHYIQAIADLCKAHGTQLAFLYLPSYGVAAQHPQEIAFFQSFGPVWIPPDSVFGDPWLHMDENHLNMEGAAKLSDWLGNKVVEMVDGKR